MKKILILNLFFILLINQLNYAQGLNIGVIYEVGYLKMNEFKMQSDLISLVNPTNQIAISKSTGGVSKIGFFYKFNRGHFYFQPSILFTFTGLNMTYDSDYYTSAMAEIRKNNPSANINSYYPYIDRSYSKNSVPIFGTEFHFLLGGSILQDKVRFQIGPILNTVSVDFKLKSRIFDQQAKSFIDTQNENYVYSFVPDDYLSLFELLNSGFQFSIGSRLGRLKYNFKYGYTNFMFYSKTIDYINGNYDVIYNKPVKNRLQEYMINLTYCLN